MEAARGDLLLGGGEFVPREGVSTGEFVPGTRHRTDPTLGQAPIAAFSPRFRRLSEGSSMKKADLDRVARYSRAAAQSYGPPHGVLWEGPSPVDGAPIVAIATWAVSASKANSKTGQMVQVYILRADMNPIDAIKSGADGSVCGRCGLRGLHGAKRACYVIPMRLAMIWEKYARGEYPRVAITQFAGLPVRWGAYGDPAMLPEALVRKVNKVAAFHTGYTHQWREPWAQWSRGLFMASVETLVHEKTAHREGWGTFRVGAVDSSDNYATQTCPHAINQAIQCLDCRQCDGQQHRIYVPAHGAGLKHVPAERKRRLAVVV